MTTADEMRLAIIEHWAEALVDLNDEGDWSPAEVDEAQDAAEEYATVLFKILDLTVTEIDGDEFKLSGKLQNVRNFMDSYFAEPLVKDVN